MSAKRCITCEYKAIGADEADPGGGGAAPRLKAR
jgi:hypothetical protein